MALRNLAVKMRIPASAAPRLLSSPRAFPASGSRALHLSSFHSPAQVTREWYTLQRTRYDDVTRELKNLSRVVLWTERMERFLWRLYLVGAPLTAASVVLQWRDYQKADENAMK